MKTNREQVRVSDSERLRELLQRVLDEHVYIGNEVNWCIFCGRWPDDHEADCLIYDIRVALADTDKESA